MCLGTLRLPASSNDLAWFPLASADSPLNRFSLNAMARRAGEVYAAAHPDTTQHIRTQHSTDRHNAAQANEITTALYGAAKRRSLHRLELFNTRQPPAAAIRRVIKVAETASTLVRRIMRITTLLSVPGGRSTREIYEQLLSEGEYGSPTLRQIQRDLQTLESCDIIEHEEDGRSNIWSLRDTHRNILPLTYKGSELLSLYILKSYLHQFAGTSVEKHTKSLLNKLEQSAGGTVVSMALEHSFGRYTYATDSRVVESVIESIRDARWVRVRYTNNAGLTHDMDVLLCRLFNFNGELYVATYHPRHRDYIALAVRKIESLHTADTDYGEHRFNESTFLQSRFGVFHGKARHIRLHIRQSMAEFFLSRSWHPTQRMKQQKNGDVVMELDAPLAPDLITWIVGWSSVMKVTSPPELKEAIKKRLHEALEWYD